MLKYILTLICLIIFVLFGFEFAHSGNTKTTSVTTTLTRTQLTTVVAEDRDSDKGDAVSKSKGESLADAGGAKPKGLIAGVVSCGSERAAVKHLTDGFVLPSQPTVMTPDQLVAMTAPTVSSSSSRLPVEKQLIELKNVHVIAAKQEADSDLHIIITTSTGQELNVESPQAVCDSSSPYAVTLAKARAAIDAAMPNVSSSAYTPENLTATIEGTLFFDVLHGQRGAKNGVELHPVTFFSTGNTPPPPVTTTATTVASTTTGAITTTPTTTTNPVTYSSHWPGCSRYPHRIYYKHVAHRYCRASFFTTP